MTSYEERMRRAFDVGAIGKAYVDRGGLTEQAFGRILRNTLEIRSLGIVGLDWLLFDQLLSVCRHISLTTHIEALSAGLGRPFVGVAGFYETVVELELMPPSVLNRTEFHRKPGPGRLFGEILVEVGLVTEITLQRALGIKEIIRTRTGDNVIIGQILRSLGVSIVDLFQILGLQVGIAYEGLDASAPRIYEAARRLYDQTTA